MSDATKESRMGFERFTDRARRVMQLANESAHRHNSDTILPVHVLWALAEEGRGLAATALRDLGVTPAAIERRMSYYEPDPNPPGRLPRALGTDAILEGARRASEARKDLCVGTEHLLIACMADSTLVPVVEAAGTTIGEVIDVIDRLLEPDNLRRLAQARFGDASGHILRQLIEELKDLDHRADRIRETLKLDQRGEILWRGEEGEHVIEVVADGYGGATHRRYNEDGEVIGNDHYATIREAARAVETELDQPGATELASDAPTTQENG